MVIWRGEEETKSTMASNSNDSHPKGVRSNNDGYRCLERQSLEKEIGKV